MDPQLKVAYEALTKDASLWDSVADTLEEAQNDVRGIEVYRGAFSFGGIDAADTYLELHARVLDLLGAGATATRDGANALRTVRNEFERLEDYTQAELYSVWQPVV